MTLPASGSISLSQVNTELSEISTTLISLGQANLRHLFGVYTGAISLSDGYGKALISFLRTLDNPNAYDTSLNDYFGRAVSISNSYAIVGAYAEDDIGGTGSGKAYIFDNATGVLLWTLDNPNAYDTSLNDNFGRAVSISESYAIVGAMLEDDAGGLDSGKAYIYDNATGVLLWTLDNPNAYDTSAVDGFGYSIAISDSYAIVGAPYEDDAGGTGSGKAYIYNSSTGALLWTLDNPNAYGTTDGDYFGYSVSISNSYAIIGAYLEDDAGGLSSGKAYIFDNATGTLLWTLDNPNAYDTSAGDSFGYSVSISDIYAIVGAYQEDDISGLGSGIAYIYNSVTGALLHTLDNPNAYSSTTGDYFGYYVSISDSYAIVGAPYEDDAGGLTSGKAYIYNPATGALLSTLDNPNAYNTSDGDSFGYSIAISDNYAIVGAYLEDDAGGLSSGKAYIYKV
jgi:outer membrane protein assembly factor BamB